MAYNKEEVYKQALEAVEKHHLYFIDDIVAYIPCTRTTFYEFFPLESDKLNNIKRELYNNKIVTKVEIRKKLGKGERAAELLSLYKLIATEDERIALSQSYQKVSGDLKTTTNVQLTPEQFEEVLKSITPDE